MLYYIDQARIPSFGLVKTESDFIVRSVETGWDWFVYSLFTVDKYIIKKRYNTVY